jgi:hypothetical protein
MSEAPVTLRVPYREGAHLDHSAGLIIKSRIACGII